MTHRQLFDLCNASTWQTAGLDTQYNITVTDYYVILAFQPSSSKQDWIDNFNFPVKPYRDMKNGWLAHGGFVRAWKAAKDTITKQVLDVLGVKSLYITGYSHGGAIATLAHEWFIFNGYHASTYTWGSPRVLWLPKKQVQDRFRWFKSIQHRRDIVPHAPPAIFGYRHVGYITKIGERGVIGTKHHEPDAYRLHLT